MQTNDTTPWPASPPTDTPHYKSALSGISGSAKVHTGTAGGRGGPGAAGTRPGPAREAPGDALGPGAGAGRGSGGGSGPPAALLPPPPLPRGRPGRPATWGTRSARGALARRPRVALLPARDADLPPSRPRGSNSSRAPPPAASAFSGPRGQARPATGALCAPNLDPGDACPRPARGAADGCGCARREPDVLEPQRLCSLREAKHFLHIKKKKCSFLRFDLAGAIFKALPLGGAPAPRDGGAVLLGPPLTPPQSRGPGLARRPRPRGWCLDTKPGDPGREPAASTSHACGPRRWSAVCWRDSAMRAEALFLRLSFH